jgi:hypothetical protein
MAAHRLPSLLAVVACAAVALAGCATSGAKEGTFALAISDTLAGGRLDLKGVFLHGEEGWVYALDNGTSYSFEATGSNVSSEAEAPAGDYDGVRILFAGLLVGNRSAELAQSGVELALNFSLGDGARTEVLLDFAWADALFESADGLAFQPALSRLVVTVDGAETLRLEAQAIRTDGGLAPVARMRIFDASGLEAFASTFVADSPADPVVANAGELVLSATGSEAVMPGTSLTSYSWDIDGVQLAGATIRQATPISGGNMTVRLTVTDSQGGSDAQTVRLAVKPGTVQRAFNFTASTTGLLGEGAAEHAFGPILAGEFDGAPARLVHLSAVLEPGASALPVGDLDFLVRDGAGETVASASGSGSQHRIEEDITGAPGDGEWSVVVEPQQAFEAAYTVTVTLTWQGVNPGIEAFLADYDDGHTHEH